MLFDSICFGDVYKERLDIFYCLKRRCERVIGFRSKVIFLSHAEAQRREEKKAEKLKSYLFVSDI